MAARSVRDKVVDDIYGYFLARRDEDEEIEDSDEEDDYMDLGDYNIYSSGSVVVDAKPLKVQLVSFKEYGTGKVYTIQGRFPITDQWWAARIKVNKTKQSKKYLYGYPHYEIRSDPAVHDVMATFMNQCCINPQTYGSFLTKLDQMKLKERLNFHNLEEMIGMYEKGGGEAHVADMIRIYTKTGIGEIVSLCTAEDYTDFFQYLPQLLPRHFYGILLYKPDKKEDFYDEDEEKRQEKEKKQEKKKEEHALMRHRMNSTLKNDPWAFGFSCVLQKKTGLSGCEAPLERFYKSHLMDKIDTVERDALHVYDAVKNICRQDGHTYVYYEKLKSKDCRYLEDHRLKNEQWHKVLDFLEDHNVIKREKPHLELRVYLTKLWKAETTIAECINTLLKDNEESPFTFDIDFKSEQFQSLKDDPYQKKAARLISQNPIVCINGKGGCGKTTVVSAVFKHLEGLLEEKRTTEDEMNDSQENNLLSQISKDAEEGYLSQTPTKSDCNTSMDHSAWFSPPSNTTTPNRYSFDVEDDSFSGHCVSSQGQEPSVCGESATNTQNGIALEKGSSGEEAAETEEIKNLKEPIILLTAPTGKAANLIGERAKLPSFTLHSVVMSYWNWKKSKSVDDEGKPVEWRFRNVQALVVDECSLVAVSIFSSLLKALMDESQLKKVVLLGDVYQLPSIEPGNFLPDVFKALDNRGLSIVLLKNHRTDAHLIVNNATRIQQKQLPIIDPANHFYQFNIADDFDRDFTIHNLLSGKYLDMGSDNNFQFVAFRNQDCDAINEMCCKRFSQHSIKSPKGNRVFQVNDKVCCTKNGTVADYNSPAAKKKKGTKPISVEENKQLSSNSTCNLEGKGFNQTLSQSSQIAKLNISSNKGEVEEEEEELDGCKSIKLCNGEIFFIREDTETEERGKSTRFLVLETEDAKKRIKVDFGMLNRVCKLRHAWARTIHTYQGSESPTVIYVVGSAVCQTWQHVYTAVTRGKKQVVIVTKPEHLLKAVSTSPYARKTSLEERLMRIEKDLWPTAKSPKKDASAMGSQLPKPSPSGKCASQSSSQRILQSQCGIQARNTDASMDCRGLSQQGGVSCGTSDCLTDTANNQGGDQTTVDSQNSSIWSDFGMEEQELVDELEATYNACVSQAQPVSAQVCENKTVTKVKKNLFATDRVPNQDSYTARCYKTMSSQLETYISEDDDELDSDSQNSESLLSGEDGNLVINSPKRQHSACRLADHKRTKVNQVSMPVTDSYVSPVRRVLENFNFDLKK